MSAREFQEWQEYYKVEPFGDDWMQAGTIAAMLSTKPVAPKKFIPYPKKPLTEEQLHRWAQRHNEKVSKRGGK